MALISFAKDGNELYRQGQYDKAIEIDPKNPELWNSIGLALMAMDRVAEAENRIC